MAQWVYEADPAALKPLCRAGEGQECSFPQGDTRCPFLLFVTKAAGKTKTLPNIFRGSCWGSFPPPVRADLKNHFSVPPNLAPLPCFLQDLGMESTSLDDVLYRYASFRNLVDPITHDLIISLARYIHCPKPVGAMVSSHLANWE